MTKTPFFSCVYSCDNRIGKMVVRDRALPADGRYVSIGTRAAATERVGEHTMTHAVPRALSCKRRHHKQLQASEVRV